MFYRADNRGKKTFIYCRLSVWRTKKTNHETCELKIERHAEGVIKVKGVITPVITGEIYDHAVITKYFYSGSIVM